MKGLVRMAGFLKEKFSAPNTVTSASGEPALFSQAGGQYLSFGGGGAVLFVVVVTFFYFTITLIGVLHSLAMWPILAGNSQRYGASLSLAGISSQFLAGNLKSAAQDCNWLRSCQGLYVQSVIEALRKSNETRAWTKVRICDYQRSIYYFFI
jgi:hypothetical protein